jgi:hypothetical protein
MELTDRNEPQLDGSRSGVITKEIYLIIGTYFFE